MAARHRSSRAPRARCRAALPSARGMLISAVLVTGATIIGVSTAGGSFASWKTSVPLAAATVTSGSLGLTVNGVTNFALDGSTWSHLLPGDVASRQVTVKNTGTTPATITVATTEISGALNVHVKAGACAGTITGVSSTVAPIALANPLAGGATATVCIQLSLTPAATQNQPTAFTMTLNAEQVRP